MKKFKATTKKEVEKALSNPNKVITDLSISMKNLKKDNKITEEGFGIDKDFILDLYNSAKTTNADEVRIKFEDIGVLGGASVTLTVEMPKRKLNNDT